MTFRKPFLPETRRVVVPDTMVAHLQEDIICDRLFLTGLSYCGIDGGDTHPKRSDSEDNTLLYMRQGRGNLHVFGTYKRFNAGQYFIVPAAEDVTFSPSKGEECEFIAIRFRGVLVDEIFKSSTRHAVSLIGSDRRDLEHLLRKLFSCFDRGLSIYSLRYATCVLSYLFANLFFSSSTEDDDKLPMSSGNMVVETASQYMREHIEQRIRLEEIAAHVGYTPTYFSSLFRRKTGYSPITYFNIMKMQRACELLTTTKLRILDICAQLGIEDNYYFSRLFTKTIGMSPKQYRKTHTIR